MRTASGGTLAALAALAACAGPRAEPPEVRTVPADEIVRLAGLPDFVDVREVVRGRNGIWILDSESPYLTYVPADDPGAFRRFGREGSGPGELRAPRGLRAVDGGVVVFDATLRRLVGFTDSGGVLAVPTAARESEAWIRPDLAEVTHVDPWRVRVAGDVEVSLAFAGRVTSAPDVWTGALVGTTPEREAMFRLELDDLAPPRERPPTVFAPVPLWDVCGESVVLWNPARQAILRTDLSGTPLAETTVPADAPEITQEGVEAFLRYQARLELGPGFERAGIDFRAQARQVRDAFGATGPAFVDLRCGAGTEVWLQTFDLGDHPLGLGSTWVRLAQGHPQERVRFPSDFRPLTFDENGVTGVERTRAGDHLATWRWRTGRIS